MSSVAQQPAMEETPLVVLPRGKKRKRKKGKKNTTVTHLDGNTCAEGSAQGDEKIVVETDLSHSLNQDMSKQDQVGAATPTDCGGTSSKQSTCLDGNNERAKMAGGNCPEIQSLPTALSCDMEQNVVEQTTASHLPKKKRKKKKRKVVKNSVPLDENTCLEGGTAGDEKAHGETISHHSSNTEMPEDRTDATVGAIPASSNCPVNMESVTKIQSHPIPISSSCDMDQNVVEQRAVSPLPKKKKKKRKVAKLFVPFDQKTSVEGSRCEEILGETILPQSANKEMPKGCDDASVGANSANVNAGGNCSSADILPCTKSASSCDVEQYDVQTLVPGSCRPTKKRKRGKPKVDKDFVPLDEKTRQEETTGNDQNMAEVSLPCKKKKPRRKKKKKTTMDVGTSCGPCDSLLGSKSRSCVAETKDKAQIENICVEGDTQVKRLDCGACSVAIGLPTSSEEKMGLKDSSSCIDSCSENVEMKKNLSSSLGDSHFTPATPLTNMIGLPRRKLLVLDLNGLLADFVSPGRGPLPDFRITGKCVFTRPYYKEFLDFCFEKFDVGMWSSRMRVNLDNAVKLMLDERSRRKLRFCWCQDECTKTKSNTIENYRKPLVLKELRKLWEDVEQHNLPWKKGDYNESNTLLLDDSPYKALMNPPYTAIFPEPYDFKRVRKTDTEIGPNSRLWLYLEKLANSTDDVPKFVKENPFGQRPITESHPKWPFYAKVIEYVLTGKKSKKNPDSGIRERINMMGSWYGPNNWVRQEGGRHRQG